MLVAEVTVLFERLVDDALELWRQVGVEARGRSGRAVQNGVVDNGCSRARERLSARGHLVEHGAKAEQVRARVELLASCLFGRHVRYRAHRHARTGEELFCGCGRQT